MSTQSEQPRKRAPALPPDERRASIIAAAVPLVTARGRAVTTAEIAQAAGVAEGTVFWVFSSKDEILDASVAAVTSTDTFLAELEAASRLESVDERLLGAAQALERQFRRAVPLVLSLGLPGTHQSDGRDSMLATLINAVSDFVSRDIEAGKIVGEESLVARAVTGLVFAAVFQHVHAGIEPAVTSELVEIVLDGVRRREGSGS